MKHSILKNFSLAAALFLGIAGTSVNAKENVGVAGNSNKEPAVTAAGCAATTAQADLDINNVRATIFVGGDMWWDGNDSPRYEIPINSDKHSLFAGALWIGGIDAGGQIKVAGQTYRQFGNDFWAGPLDTTVNVDISPEQCHAYDRHWKMLRTGINAFVAGDLTNPDYLTIKDDMESWPGNGDATYNQGQYLAPFVDVNADGIYDPNVGDYPGYNLSGTFPTVPGTIKTVCNDYLFGDQTLWWVFNDVGGVHTETGSLPIGLEIRAQGFAFKTNDEVNNMTFYKYQIINRSSQTLTETYFGQWVDPDLGNPLDDFVGCDVNRGLGFCYNGLAEDGTASGYGLNPPAVGVDFFQGPIADVDDSTDNDRDGCTDCTFLDSAGVIMTIDDNILGEQIIMSKYVYYNNVTGPPNGNPVGFTDFYHYLQGIWLDNQPITYGADGRDPGKPVCDFMFPGTSDPVNFPVLGEWSEFTAGNVPEDRRFLQSAGTFTLAPGAVNYITTGVVWARTQQGGPLESVELLRSADDKAQALFDNCFKLIDGPDAPELVIRELDKKFIFSIQNYNTPKVELYDQVDPTITIVQEDSLKHFKFQGYQIYQMRDGTVTTTDIGDPDKVRLLRQFDIKDGVDQLVNFNFDPSLNANVPVEMVNGADDGIIHTFIVDQDLFATGTASLVNHKTYYYTIVAYAYNQYKKYDPNDPTALDGQKKPYLAGRNNIKNYSAIPHHPQVENAGQVFGAEYGEGPKITRIEGQGNGGMYLNFADEAGYAELIKNPPYRIAQPQYMNDQGPVDIEVYDPTLIMNSIYELRFDSTTATARWRLKNDIQDMVYAERPIGEPNEQVIPEWGLTTTIVPVIEAGKPGAVNNALLGSSITYADNNLKWYDPIMDTDNSSSTLVDYEDWIRSGNTTGAPYPGLDDNEVYENVVGGTWGPFKLTTDIYPGPKPDFIAEGQVALSPSNASKTSIASVDIIITSDRSLWSRAAVIEMGTGGTIGGASRFDLRKSPSVGKDGLPGDNSISNESMSWFPGYAVNIETGERLNIVFGENSSLAVPSTHGNGGDMIWNPTSTKWLPGSGNTVPVFGGMHYIYVFGHNSDDPAKDMPMYDECKFFVEKIKTHTPANLNKRNVWKDCMYVSIPMIGEQYDDKSFPNKNFPDAIPSEVKVKIRIARSYRPYAPVTSLRNNEPLIQGTTYYVTALPVSYSGTPYKKIGDSFVAGPTPNFSGVGTVTTSPPENGYNPMYVFGTENLANSPNNVAAAKSALDIINVVPNPYYAFSSYEENQLDNRIKITNLPPECTVSIFTLNGTLVKRFKRDVQKDNSEGVVYDESRPNTETSIDWDLKNHKNIPIASGIYLIHVEAPGLGERTLKWFGMIRPIDLDTF